MTEIIRAVIPDTQEPPSIVLDSESRPPETLHVRGSGTHEDTLGKLALLVARVFLGPDYRLPNAKSSDNDATRLTFQTKRLQAGRELSEGYLWGPLPSDITLR